MKPLSLVVEGFMPFKARAEIDFTGLELFAIQGPTGSGKSSLLDAITYALYGQTDRLGNRGAEALIASGEDHFTLIFTFEMAGERYRITRSKGRKAAQNQLRLEQYKAERWTGEQGGVRATEARIRKLLGLDFESFTRAIMLPQGKFDALLRGTRAERQSLLGELTNLGHVTQMYQYASKQAAGLQADLKSKQSLLDSEYAGVTPEEVAALSMQSRELETQLLDLSGERDSLQQALTRLQAQEATYREYQEALEVRAALQAQSPQLEAGAKRAAQGRAVLHALPLLQGQQRAEQQLAQATQHAAQAAQKVQAATLTQQQAAEALAALQGQQQAQQAQHAEQLEMLEQLGQALPLLHAQQQKEQEVARAQAQVSAHEASTQQAAQAVARAEQAATQAQEQASSIVSLEQQATDLEQAAALMQKLKQFGGTPKTAHKEPLEWDEHEYFAVREAGRKLSDIRVKLTSIGAEKVRLITARQELDTDKQLHQQEQQRLTQLTQQGQSLAQEHQELSDQLQRSGLLAYHSQLHIGELCPLCGQEIKKLPDVESFGDTEKLQARLKVIDENLKERREEFNVLRGALKITAKHLEQRQKEWEEWQENTLSQEQQYQQELKSYAGDEPELAQRYLAGLARKVAHFGADPGEQRRKLLVQIEELRQQVQRTQQAHTQAQSAYAGARASLDVALQQLMERQQGAQQAQQQLTERLSELGLSAQQVKAAPDPAAERRKLQAQAQALQTQLDEARAAQAQAASALAGAQATYDSASSEQAQRAADMQQATAALETALQGLGLSAQEVEQAALPIDQIEALEAAQRSHLAQLEQLSVRLSDLETKLGAQPFDPAKLTQVARDLHAAESALSSARERSGELKHAIADLTKRLERKHEYQQQTGELTKQAGLWATLSTSLRTSEFQQFLLEDLESRLLAGAGALLHDISDGRYRLVLEGGEYAVEDLWNGGERRAVKTLSGGETFLASLALAITLSDYLAGNKVLGALFLDEGFGTLDPQALDLVATALEGLRTQGRMVGVITHVESLSERLPSRLLVSKSVAGSSVTRIDE